VGTPVMWILLPHSLGAEALASLILAAVWSVVGRTPPRHRRQGEDTGGEKVR
jgi:hypothetical protein